MESMNEIDLKQRNIENLVALWTAMGAVQGDGPLPSALRISESWPHRCWLEWGASAGDIAALAEHAAALPLRGIVPVLPWPAGGEALLVRSLEAHQFKLRAELRAMVFELDGSEASESPELDVRHIEDATDLDRWTEVCSGSFGYEIDGAVVRRLAGAPGLQLFLAYSQGEPAATALTFQTGDTIGIHQVGVPPEFRGRGLAQTLMQHVMAVCQASGARYATLQASAAGEGIYRKMGFAPQFTIRTYRRDQPA